MELNLEIDYVNHINKTYSEIGLFGASIRAASEMDEDELRIWLEDNAGLSPDHHIVSVTWNMKSSSGVVLLER